MATEFATGVGRALLDELTGRAMAAGFAPDGTEEPFDVDGVAVPEVRYARELTA